MKLKLSRGLFWSLPDSQIACTIGAPESMEFNFNRLLPHQQSIVRRGVESQLITSSEALPPLPAPEGSQEVFSRLPKQKPIPRREVRREAQKIVNGTVSLAKRKLYKANDPRLLQAVIEAEEKGKNRSGFLNWLRLQTGPFRQQVEDSLRVSSQMNRAAPDPKSQDSLVAQLEVEETEEETITIRAENEEDWKEELVELTNVVS